jgi:hypothetical protein
LRKLFNRIKNYLKRMSKQRIVNKGAHIKNGNMVGNQTGPRATPVNGSQVEGVRAQMAEQAKINAAKQTPKPTIEQTAKIQPTQSPKKGISH